MYVRVCACLSFAKNCSKIPLMFKYNSNTMYSKTVTGEMKETMEGECMDNRTDESDITASHSSLSSHSA